MVQSGIVLIGCLLATAVNADRPERNLKRMLGAARQLEWSDSTLDRRAYLLVKTRTIRSPVAVIFGYYDNEEACREIATDLTNAANARAANPGPDLYVCDAIY